MCRSSASDKLLTFHLYHYHLIQGVVPLVTVKATSIPIPWTAELGSHPPYVPRKSLLSSTVALNVIAHDPVSA